MHQQKKTTETNDNEKKPRTNGKKLHKKVSTKYCRSHGKKREQHEKKEDKMKSQKRNALRLSTHSNSESTKNEKKTSEAAKLLN